MTNFAKNTLLNGIKIIFVEFLMKGVDKMNIVQ